MCKNTIYSRLVRAGATLGHHESDLYVRVNAATLDLLATARREGHAVIYFTDTQTGERWADIPFAYDPWWERRGFRAHV